MIRLDEKQYRAVKKMTRAACANNDCGNCLLLDDGETCVCVQSISYSLLCRYFREAVLPADRQLCEQITRSGETDLKRCAVCGSTFAAGSNRANQTITECIPALDFIKRLIVHIPEKHFKMLRYYGIYAKHHKQESKLHKCISSEKHRYLCKFYNWQNMILLTFGYDPLKCPKCGKSMFAFEVYYKKTALFEQYRKVMGYG